MNLIFSMDSSWMSISNIMMMVFMMNMVLFFFSVKSMKFNSEYCGDMTLKTLFKTILLLAASGLMGYTPGILSDSPVVFLMGLSVWFSCFYLWMVFYLDFLSSILINSSLNPMLAFFTSLIEMVTHCMKGFILSFRLMINMMVGKVLSVLCCSMKSWTSSVLLSMVLMHLESLVVILQTYIFIVLSIMYIKESLQMN